jgi:predicted unusual protein kinase regulating ubiquinone biosynthesis (AarF/ABC1/UbiB family)
MTDDRDRDKQRRAAERKVGLARLFARAKQVLTTDPTGTDADDQVAADAGAAVLARQAGELKAGMAKLAQLAAYEPHLDDAGAASEAARGRLGALWDQAPAMTAAAIGKVVEAELGAPPQVAFARWDPTPIAAASLGQVHAATGHDGVEYAVKVQYPGIADALRADLASAGFAKKLAGGELGHGLGAGATAALRDAVLGELDYRREADALERFRRAWEVGDGGRGLAGRAGGAVGTDGPGGEGTPAIAIPRVDRERSTARVLTMERGRGTAWRAAAALPEAARDAAAAAVVRFAWGSPLAHGLCNADPNPGNYLVDEAGGRVWFLDFGCAIELAPEVVSGDRELWFGLLDPDVFAGTERFRVALSRLGLLVRADSLASDAHRDWERLVALPVRDDRFAWTPAYAGALATAFRRVLVAGGVALPAPVFMLWRQRLGVAAVLGMLGARCGLGPIVKDLIGTGRKAL